MSIKATEKYFDFPFGNLAGVLLNEKAMKQVAKLLYRQNQELKELLHNNIDNIEVSNWTLAYPNGQQESIHYIHDESSWDSKEHRISLVDKIASIRKLDHVYIGSREDAISEHMKLYDDNTEVVLNG